MLKATNPLCIFSRHLHLRNITQIIHSKYQTPLICTFFFVFTILNTMNALFKKKKNKKRCRCVDVTWIGFKWNFPLGGASKNELMKITFGRLNRRSSSRFGSDQNKKRNVVQTDQKLGNDAPRSGRIWNKWRPTEHPASPIDVFFSWFAYVEWQTERCQIGRLERAM